MSKSKVVKELRNELQALAQQIETLQQRRCSILQRLAAVRCCFAIGDRCEADSRGGVLEVNHIQFLGDDDGDAMSDRPYFAISLKLPNGEFRYYDGTNAELHKHLTKVES